MPPNLIDLIAELTAERDALRAEVKSLKHDIAGWIPEVQALEAKVEELKAALDEPKANLWHKLTNERAKRYGAECSLGNCKAHNARLRGALEDMVNMADTALLPGAVVPHTKVGAVVATARQALADSAPGGDDSD